MSTLRDHSAISCADGRQWSMDCVASRSICMHAGEEPYPGQTVGSLASEVHLSEAVHWVTGSAAPCTSIFKPVLFGVPLPPHGPTPADRFDAAALWWRHEQLHRTALLGDFDSFLAAICGERDSLEAEFHRRVHAVLNGGDARDRAHVVAECWREAIETEERWHTFLLPAPARHGGDYIGEWRKMNEVATLPLPRECGPSRAKDIAAV